MLTDLTYVWDPSLSYEAESEMEATGGLKWAENKMLIQGTGCISSRSIAQSGSTASNKVLNSTEI